MKTFKLILKSLISNDSCIDGGRKKPWYFAAIMFFLSMIFALVPLFVQTMKANGDDSFKTYTYGADAALVDFNNYLEDEHISMYVKTSPTGDKFITSEKDGVSYPFEHPHLIPGKNENNEPITVTDYWIIYRNGFSLEEANNISGGANFIYFSENQIYIYIPGHDIKINCVNATKYLDEGTSINALLSTSTDPTTKLNETFGNWKHFIRNAYNSSRLTQVWQSCAISGGINVGITLLMGFLIWILTRGKKNPYRLFNLWETQKMSWWCTISPSILALGLGFLLPRFGFVIYPMLLTVRVMWLSMRSLRPDGTGYAESK